MKITLGKLFAGIWIAFSEVLFVEMFVKGDYHYSLVYNLWLSGGVLFITLWVFSVVIITPVMIAAAIDEVRK